MKELLIIIVILLIYISIQLSIYRNTQHNYDDITKNGSVKILEEIPEIKVSIKDNSSIVTKHHTTEHIHNNIPHQHIPINIPTRGGCDTYRQIGVLTNSDNSKILPLYGKRLWNGASKWQYYTQTDKFVSVHLPVFSNDKDCSCEYGCDELSDKDTITIPQFNESFTVTLYHIDAPRYIPYIC
tara:strand:+ start:9504 stop:10052 length:549 start_codon:yes stop_codon:yes gene_type:complete